MVTRSLGYAGHTGDDTASYKESHSLARWTGHPELEGVLSAAQAWRARCVEDDGSILSDERLWTAEHLAALRDLFRTNPIEGADRSFYDKLHEQLLPSPSHLKHLAAEVVWVLLLFPHHSKYGPDRKIERVREVWGWAGNEPPGTHLDGPALMGVGNPGTAYLTRFPNEFGFVLDAMAAWKARPSTERAAVLAAPDAPWDFAAWLETIPGADRRPMRHALLFFLFPDNFESIVTTEHKRQIVAAFRPELPVEARPKGKRPTALECDHALYTLRNRLETQQGDKEVSFYRPPFAQRWQTGVRDDARALIGSSLSQMLKGHGLELHECGSRKRTLAACGEVSDATGFWTKPTDDTNKPLRWIIHIVSGTDGVFARLAGQHGDRRLAFAHTKGGISGMIVTRIVPAVQLNDGTFAFVEAWEWMLLFGFLPALPPGSSGQMLGDFDPTSGTLDYMGKRQPYITAALVALSEGEDTFEHPKLQHAIRYSDATAAVAEFLKVKPTFGEQGNADAGA